MKYGLLYTCVHAGVEQPIPLWNEHDLSTDGDKPKILLYSLNLMFKVRHIYWPLNIVDDLDMQSPWLFLAFILSLQHRAC